MFSFSVLASGSRANAIVVGNDVTRILVDCGLSAREAARRLHLVGISPQSIHAVVLTHEHRDHTAGAAAFAARFSVPVFANAPTAAALEELVDLSRATIELFETGESFALGGITIDPFMVDHDAAEPVALRITYGGVSVAVITDLGQTTPLVVEKSQGVDALVLESNHDLLLLRECFYPRQLKERIASPQGHLSNGSAAALVEELVRSGNGPRYLIGAHVSENSNHPDLVREAMHGAFERTSLREPPELRVADAYSPTAPVELDA